ncbi:peptidylprolyl isomerase [Rubrivirga sp.]|uniref:peptidylprolyl isomerase n=1 Tax=Rubrivirga sp. TaxID=1885344 RepID=UPI003B52B51F
MRTVLLLTALAVAGCASTAVPTSPVAPGHGRPSDGLLSRPDLQALVDLQVRRDGAALAEALSSPDSVVRARAAFALGSVQAEGALAALRARLDDPVPAVRADAAFAIGQTADSTVGVALALSLRREATPSVTAELLDALGKVGGRSDLGVVLDVALPDGLEAARALALARFGMRDVTSDAWAEWLGARFQAAEPAVRQAAAYALTRSPVAGWRGQAGAIRAAFDALAGDPARADLARALGRLDDPVDVPRLANALATDPDWRTRVNAARALAESSDAAARGALARAVDDPNPHVAQTAAATFAALGPTPDAVALALDVVADGGRPWPTQAALLPVLAPSRPDAVLAWADRQADPFAQAAALTALGAADDGAAVTRLFTGARSDDARLATAALGALRQRWATGTYGARRFYDAFAHALRRADLATTSAAAPALADSAFWPLGAGALLREVYATLGAPADVEPMAAIVQAIGRVRDGGEIDFLLGVAMAGHPVLRQAARDALNDRLSEGVDVELGVGGAPATTTIDWAQLANVGRRPRLVLETTRGTVVLELDTESAPQTVQRITTTAAQGLYDGVPFHRVVANFVVQGGDYARRDGYGGPETAIRSELTRRHYRTGTVGMASSGKDTEGSQFFVTHSPQPHLDGRYTAFGRVVEGQDVVDQIMQGDVVRRARVVADR